VDDPPADVRVDEARIVKRIGRETIRMTLANYDLKPWQEARWVMSEINSEFVKRMEDALRVYAGRTTRISRWSALMSAGSYFAILRGQAR
jgi:hypothetical protein